MLFLPLSLPPSLPPPSLPLSLSLSIFWLAAFSRTSHAALLCLTCLLFLANLVLVSCFLLVDCSSLVSCFVLCGFAFARPFHFVGLLTLASEDKAVNVCSPLASVVSAKIGCRTHRAPTASLGLAPQTCPFHVAEAFGRATGNATFPETARKQFLVSGLQPASQSQQSAAGNQT